MKLTDHVRGLLQPNPPDQPRDFPGVHLYGDSIMANGIASRMTSLGLFTGVLDYSQPGDTAANAWRRFAYDARSLSKVVLQHGTNDLTGGVDPVPYLRKMAEYALAEGREVIFTGITRRELTLKYDWGHANYDIAELATELGCAHAGWDHIQYSSDDFIHPDAAMQDRLARNLLEYLK